jgi:hypothetical protein
LLYAYEHGARAGLWITDPTADPVLDSVAIAWAAAPAGSRFTARRDLTDFGLPGEHPVSDAPMFPADAPEALLISDEAEGSIRRLSLGVRSRIGAEVLRFQVDPRSGARVRAINGHPLVGSDSIEWVEHWGAPDSLVYLDVTMRAGAPIALHVVEQLLRPGEIVVADVFRRPPELAPDVSAQSDRALFRSSMEALLRPAADTVPPGSF